MRLCGARGWRLLAAVGAAGVIPLLAASPADAKLSGPCEASGVLEGVEHNPKTEDDIDIPAEGDVAWQGSVPGGDDAGKGPERAIKGEVKVKLPGGIGEATIDSWNKPSSTYSNSGDYHYELPSIIEGIPIPLTGFHEEAGVRCDGSVTLTVGDGGFGNPATIPALVLTAISATLLIVSVRAGG